MVRFEVDLSRAELVEPLKDRGVELEQMLDDDELALVVLSCDGVLQAGHLAITDVCFGDEVGDRLVTSTGRDVHRAHELPEGPVELSTKFLFELAQYGDLDGAVIDHASGRRKH